MTLFRLLDANANRAAEAARTLEDAARFLLGDASLSAPLKTLRHDLAQAVQALGPLHVARSAATDVGAEVHTAEQGVRGSTYEVAAAATQRLQQALRVLEEFAKTAPPPGPAAALQVEQLRYRAYDLGRDLLTRLGSSRRRQWRLCVLLTESACTQRPWSEVLDACVEGGADCIQVREKHLSDPELLERLAVVRARAQRHATPPAVVLNDRVDLALAAGVDGVHLGQHDLSAEQARRITGHQLLIGVSTTDLDQARAAHDAGADYVGLGPMFPSSTKAKPRIAGPDYLRAYLTHRAAGRLPHLTIGGIDLGRAHMLAEAGAQGVAVCAAVCGAADPRAAVEALVQAMGEPMSEQAPGNAGSLKDDAGTGAQGPAS